MSDKNDESPDAFVRVSYSGVEKVWEKYGHRIARAHPGVLATWQGAGDPRCYWLLVSIPLESVNLHQLITDMLRQVELDTGHELEWLAVGEQHRHCVHIAIRGRDRHGEIFRFAHEYVRSRFRTIASRLVARQNIFPANV